ncbi:hypothetical protein D9M70_603170 [compost metagenome]
MRVAQRTFTQRQAAAADTARQVIAQSHQVGDAFVQLFAPIFGQSAPIFDRKRTIVRKDRQSVLDLRQRDAGALGHLDDGDPSQHAARITALVAAGAVAADQPLGLVEVQGGDGDAASLRHFADRQFAAQFAAFHNCHDGY